MSAPVRFRPDPPARRLIRKISPSPLLKRSVICSRSPAGVLPSATMGMYWHHRGAKRTVRAAKAGHELVACVSRFCYFDYKQGLADYPHRYIGGNIPLSKVYSFDPFGELPPDCRDKVIGAQCYNW